LWHANGNQQLLSTPVAAAICCSRCLQDKAASDPLEGALALMHAMKPQQLFSTPATICCSRGLQDKAASDSLEGASALMSLGIIMRNAVDLLRGMHISIDAGALVVGVFSLIEWFTVSGSSASADGLHPQN
jgi:hypothetical protein